MNSILLALACTFGAALLFSGCNSSTDRQRSTGLPLPGSSAIASGSGEYPTDPQMIEGLYEALGAAFEPRSGEKLYLDLSGMPLGHFFLESLRNKGKAKGLCNEIQNVYDGNVIIAYRHKITGQAVSIARFEMKRLATDTWRFTIDTSSGKGSGFGSIFTCVYNSKKWTTTQSGVIVE